MKKILTTLLLLVCGSGVFAQYMSGGLVSQGTLINSRTQIIRSGFDIWTGVGAGGGLTGIGGEGVFSSSFHADVNAGYNVAPRAFLGVGLRAYSTCTSVFALYANIRVFNSPNLNSFYGDLRLGKVLGGKTQKYITEDEWGGYVYNTETYYHKPNGIMGGYSIGYIWNRWAFEWGVDLIGASVTENEEWTDEDTEISAIFDTFIKVAYRF